MRYLAIEELPRYTTISVDEAAYVSGVSRSTAYQAVKAGNFFETVRIMDRVRVLAQPLYQKLMGSALHSVGEESETGQLIETAI